MFTLETQIGNQHSNGYMVNIYVLEIVGIQFNLSLDHLHSSHGDLIWNSITIFSKEPFLIFYAQVY